MVIKLLCTVDDCIKSFKNKVLLTYIKYTYVYSCISMVNDFSYNNVMTQALKISV